MEYQHKLFNNLYQTEFIVNEFEEFIIVNVPKVGSNFFNSLIKKLSGNVYGATFNNFKEVSFVQRHHNQPIDLSKLNKDMFLPSNQQSNPHNKKIYFLYRNPWNKFVSAISQDYFKPFLELSAYGRYNESNNEFEPNPSLENELNMSTIYSQSLRSKDYLIELIKDKSPHIKSFKELDTSLFNFLVDSTLRKLDDNPDIINNGHNHPYLHILFLLKQKYNHFEFVDIDEVDILNFINKKYYNNLSLKEETFMRYENDNYLKKGIEKHITKERMVKYTTLLAYDYYYYHYLKDNDDFSLFHKPKL